MILVDFLLEVQGEERSKRLERLNAEEKDALISALLGEVAAAKELLDQVAPYAQAGLHQCLRQATANEQLFRTRARHQPNVYRKAAAKLGELQALATKLAAAIEGGGS